MVSFLKPLRSTPIRRNSFNKRRPHYWRRGGFKSSSVGRSQQASLENDSSHHANTESLVVSRLPSSSFQADGPVLLAKFSKFSPYPGWLLYFPETSYDVEHSNVKCTKAFIKWLRRECLGQWEAAATSFIDWSLLEDTRIIHVDFPSLHRSSVLATSLENWPPTLNFEEMNSHNKLNTRQLIQSLGLAIHTITSDELYGNSMLGSKPISNPMLRDKEVKVGYIAVRLTEHFPITSMRTLRADHLDTLISLHATVARLGPIKPFCCQLAFQCCHCDAEQVLIIEEDGCFVYPTKCPEKGCRSRQFTPLLSSPSTVVIDTQTMLVQETNDGTSDSDGDLNSSSVGRVPKSLTCFLDRDLVDCCMPGDFVHVTGVVSLMASSSADSSSGASRPITSLEGRRTGASNLFHLCLRVNNVTRIYSRAGESGEIDGKQASTQCFTSRLANDLTSNSTEVSGVKTSDTYFSYDDLYAIRNVAEEPSLFNLLIASFCPSICGRELAKMAILLVLFSGGHPTTVKRNSRSSEKLEQMSSPELSLSPCDEEEVEDEAVSNSEEPQFENSPASNEVAYRRGSSHVLFVGDPGIGKSQLLRAAANIAPRSVYVCGNTTSAAGLTVSTGQGQSGSGFGLEAGALVLADQGCCCIDEFDKISCDPAALLEVMEQQTVSVARGGFVCNLAARTSVLAAANPVVGHYDSSKTIYENVRISRSLLSRFDLIFILPDRPSESLDRRLSDHVLAMHMGRLKKQNKHQMSHVTSNAASHSSCPYTDPLESRLQFRTSQNIISPYLLRKYIAYAREYVHPRMTEEAAVLIRDFYVKLRFRRREQCDLFQVTIRQLESLIRLASARARADLREEISLQDAKDVCDLMEETGFGNSKPTGASGADNDCSVFAPKRRKNASATGVAATKRLLSLLQKEASRPGSNRMFTTQEISCFAAKLGALSSDDSVLYQRCDTGGPVATLIDNLNLIGALLKRGPDLYSLS